MGNNTGLAGHLLSTDTRSDSALQGLRAPLASPDLVSRKSVMDAVMTAMADAMEAKGVSLVVAVINAINGVEAQSSHADALTKLRKGLDLVDPARPLQYANAMDLMRKCADAALADTSIETQLTNSAEGAR